MAIGRATSPVFNLPSRYRRLSGPMTGIDADVVGNKSFKRPFPRIRSRLSLSFSLFPSLPLFNPPPVFLGREQ